MVETKEIESSVQMRLYGLHKRQFVVIFILFFICLFVMILIGIAGPSIIQSINYKIENPPKQLSGPYELRSEYLDNFYQRLWLTMKTMTDINDEFRQLINVNITVSNNHVYILQRMIHCQNQVCITDDHGIYTRNDCLL